MSNATEADLLRERLAAVEIVEPARPFYGRMTLEETLSDALTRIEEWDYAEDAHGYCHVRSDWLLLVTAVLFPELMPTEATS